VTPSVDPQVQARQVRARIAVFITVGAVAASSALSGAGFGAWRWVPWVLGFILIIFFTATAMAASSDRPGGRGIGLGWHGRDDRALARQATRLWPVLLVASRAMPPAAAHRWLMEAESLLAEIAVARRGAALRSYVRSAPRLMAMMWAHEVLRRVRPGSRRPR
jgi:hypothetical protein